MDPPRTAAGAGGECGAITAWGAELTPAECIAVVAALGPRKDAGAPRPRETDGGADWDWANDLMFAELLAVAVAWVD
jgi:hypothetical protein